MDLNDQAYQVIRKLVVRFFKFDFVMRSVYALLAGAANRPVNATHDEIIDFALTSGPPRWEGIETMPLNNQYFALDGEVLTGVVPLVGDSEATGRCFFINLYDDMSHGHWMWILRSWNDINGKVIDGIEEVTTNP